MKERDVVIGCISNLNWEDVELWVNSLDQSGFSGYKIVIMFSGSYELYRKLIDRNYVVFPFKFDSEHNRFYYPDDYYVVVERFKYIETFLKNFDNIRYVISTDVRDVVFQKDPSAFLEENLGYKKILVGSEGIIYENESWGKNNFILSFGEELYREIQYNTIYNAGTIAGQYKDLMELFKDIYELSKKAFHQRVPGGGGPDQAALNYLLLLNKYKRITRYAKIEDGWAAQLGTIANSKYFNVLNEPMSKIRNGFLYTSKNKMFTLVHQYDRYPQLNKMIREKYGK